MGSSTTVQLGPAYRPLEIARKYGLEKEFLTFRLVVPRPPNLTGFLFAIKRLRDLLNHPQLPAHWQTLAPFQNWADLFDLFLQNDQAIAQRCGAQVGRAYFQPVTERSVIYGYMERYPILAMICTVHEDSFIDLRYGGLQLQLLHAHWNKISNFSTNNPSRRIIRESRQRKGGKRHKNDIKLSLNAARSVRNFQPSDLHTWLYTHDTLAHPKVFCDHLTGLVPAAQSLRPIHTTLRRYFAPGYKPGRGGGGGPRPSSASVRYLFMLDYKGQRLGVVDHRGEGEGGGEGGGEGSGGGNEANQNRRTEHVARTHVRGERNRELRKKEILDLGLHPFELSDGEIDALTTPQAGSSRREGIEDAHAHIRGLEIDRRLYPWNSHAMRLEEFQKEVLPHLRSAQQSCPGTLEEISAAAAIAIAAETGRTIEEVVRLRVEQNITSPFSFCLPPEGCRCGLWKWDAVRPRYKRDVSGKERDIQRVHELAVARAEFLVYPASEIVTDLILHLVGKTQPLRKDLLFPYSAKGISAIARQWLGRKCNERRFTLSRIDHLMWDLMHRNTGGELASVCLTLGLPHPLAQVELFYAVLHEAEATSIFEQSKAMLWGQASAAQPPSSMLTDPKFGSFTGCRAFPRLDEVQRMIELFCERSEAFFALPIAEFRPAEHRQLLNGAVMYLLWHQFFSFGTRAICDAYQKLDGFLKPSGIGILSDKDFASGYKTRIVVASKPLRQHMAKLEGRMAALSKQLRGLHDANLGPVWLLDARNKPVVPRPSTIQEVLKIDKYDFPFPVNTPRRVMRYLLRKSGMTHSHAEAYMGHWWHGREPFSPFSSFQFGVFVDDLTRHMQLIFRKQLVIRGKSRERR